MILIYDTRIKGPIKFENRLYKLNKDFFVFIEISKKSFCIEASNIDVFGYGISFLESISIFEDNFDFQYQDLIINKNKRNLSNIENIRKSILSDLVEEFIEL